MARTITPSAADLPTRTTFDALRAIMQRDAWFRGCAPELQDALLAYGRERRLVPGERLFSQGEPDGGLYALTTGSLTVESVDAEGQMPVLVVLGPGHWFGELSFTDGLPRSHDAVADVASTVWHVDRHRLHDWLELHPGHWRDIARLAVGKLRVVYQVVDEEMRGPLTQRVARRLWLALQGWGWRRDAPQCEVRWSQSQLARMLGTSRGSVNRALGELQGLGAVRVRYGVIEVVDLVRLRNACDAKPPARPTPQAGSRLDAGLAPQTGMPLVRGLSVTRRGPKRQ
ncbi:Crp/Fnr family transcriptional regulator [Piscinibacter sp.]|uniref:Crp/Fnr family transcriptional regulator n=1 Tax=Piscinibacter sp. TaxID=1903157 RepID=UPI002C8559AA|nr:Crp/Fnr family transcriptional regulator [Albitalea sp.]HUG25462.1 Crp/Fnr family transcriptional regulator [Albitalea sp.]